jgi:glycerol uptake facilitator-like aquaporin
MEGWGKCFSQKSKRIYPTDFFSQIIEGIASGSLNFLSGLLVATLLTWPRSAVPVGVLFGNMILVSTLISATGSATGAHVNSMVTMATAFSGHCHPVRAMIYILCQLVGGALGGGLLRVALGKKLAYEIHNAGCWIEPAGEVDVWQAALIEFICMFILLFVMLWSRFLPIKLLLFSGS